MNEKPEDNKAAAEVASSPAEGAENQMITIQLPPEYVTVITELALHGYRELKKAFDNGSIKVDEQDPDKAKMIEGHFRGLVNIAGPDTLAEFNRLCQHLYETKQVPFGFQRWENNVSKPEAKDPDNA